MCLINEKTHGVDHEAEYKVWNQMASADPPPRHQTDPPYSANKRGEAETSARATERELDLGKSVVARDMTIAQLIVSYRDRSGGDENLPKFKATSFRQIEKYLGSMQLRGLSNAEIVDFARKRRKPDSARGQPLSPATIAMDVGYLSDLLEYGARTCNTSRRIEEMKLARIDVRTEKLVANAKIINGRPRGDEFERMIAAAENDSRPEMPSIPNHGINPLAKLDSMRGLCRKDHADDGDRISPFKPGASGAAFRRIRKRLGARPIRLHDPRHDAATSLARRNGIHCKEAMVVLGHHNAASLSQHSHFTASEVAQCHGAPQQNPRSTARSLAADKVRSGPS